RGRTTIDFHGPHRPGRNELVDLAVQPLDHDSVDVVDRYAALPIATGHRSNATIVHLHARHTLEQIRRTKRIHPPDVLRREEVTEATLPPRLELEDPELARSEVCTRRDGEGRERHRIRRHAQLDFDAVRGGELERRSRDLPVAD